MVNWLNVIPVIVGSSVLVSVIGIIAINFIFIPELTIHIDPPLDVNKEGKTQELHKITITNKGRVSATNLVVTI